MKILPELTVTRFEQLTPGDLFIFLIREEQYVALAAEDKNEKGRNLILLLGPKFPEDVSGPHLFPWTAATVISFGKEYELQLPIFPHHWSSQPPDPQQHCILLAGNTAYVRANFSPYPRRFQPCYVRMNDGLVEYGSPPGIGAFALEWEIVTPATIRDGRTVLKFQS